MGFQESRFDVDLVNRPHAPWLSVLPGKLSCHAISSYREGFRDYEWRFPATSEAKELSASSGPKGSDALASIFTYNRLKYPKAAIISGVSPYKLSKCTKKGRRGVGFYTTVS